MHMPSGNQPSMYMVRSAPLSKSRTQEKGLNRRIQRGKKKLNAPCLHQFFFLFLSTHPAIFGRSRCAEVYKYNMHMHLPMATCRGTQADTVPTRNTSTCARNEHYKPKRDTEEVIRMSRSEHGGIICWECHLYIYTYIHAKKKTKLEELLTIFMFFCIYLFFSFHVCVYICIYIRVCTYPPVHICVYIYVCAHILYIHVYVLLFFHSSHLSFFTFSLHRYTPCMLK